MYRTIEGVYRGGVIEPLEKVEVEEGTKAIITFLKSYGVEDEVLEIWRSKGLICSSFGIDPEGEEPEIEPIKVKGKPLSQTIIEDRGAK